MTDETGISKGRKKIMNTWDYYEVEFGVLADGAQTDDYEAEFAICIKANRWLSIEEAEKFLSNDMKMYDCDCVHSITKINRKEACAGFDLSNEYNWPIFG